MSAPPQTLSEGEAEQINLLFQVSNLLDTGLDRPTLALLTKLCASGVNPEALADVMHYLQQEKQRIQQQQQQQQQPLADT